MIQEHQNRYIPVLARIIPYLCLAMVSAATAGLYALGLRDTLLRSLYLSAPVAAASIIAIARPRLFREGFSEVLPRLAASPAFFRNLVLLFVLLFIGSLILLLRYEARPAAYFILVGLMAAVLLFQVFTVRQGAAGRTGLILFQVVLLAAGLIFGQSLRLPYFFGWGDTIFHMQYTSTIISTGHTSPAMGYYEFFPGFHVFTAAGTLLGNMDLQTTYFLLNGLIFLVSIPAVYLLVRQLTTNEYIPLVAVLVYSITRETIFNGTYVITRVIAFVFCLAILVLLLRGRSDRRLRAFALLLVLPLMFVHHTTLLHFSGILLALLLLEIFLARSSSYVHATYLLFFVVAFLSYWMWIDSPFFASGVQYLYVVDNTQSVSAVPIDVPIMSLFTGNVDLILIAFLMLVGIVALLRMKKETRPAGAIFALFGLAAFIAYFPGFTDAISEEFLSYRLRLLVSPFVVLAAGAGLILLLQGARAAGEKVSGWGRVALGGLVVFVLASSSALILADSTDVNLSRYLGETNRQYFTESEMDAFQFSQKYRQEAFFYSDYESNKYIRAALGMPAIPSSEIFDPASLRDGYMIYRQQEYMDRGQLVFPLGASEGVDRLYYYRPGDPVDLQGRWEQQQKIYDSGTVAIYKKKVTE